MNSIALFSLGIASMVFSFSASATIMTDFSERDLSVVGDNSITYDQSTGLEWLDITLTTGNTILATEGRSYMISDGFRWATHREIEDIFDAVLIGTGKRHLTDPTAISNAILFNYLFGNTGNVGVGTQGVSRGAPAPGLQGTFPIGSVISDTQTRKYVSDPNRLSGYTELSFNSAVGHWLVRDGTLSVPIPEPSIHAIMGLGLLGLGLSRRKLTK